MRSKKVLTFKRLFSILPPAERRLPIVKIDNKLYTWEEVYKEVIKSSKLADKMLKELERIGLL
jgi:hypothetical protein